jgi:hypothetical protein
MLRPTGLQTRICFISRSTALEVKIHFSTAEHANQSSINR